MYIYVYSIKGLLIRIIKLKNIIIESKFTLLVYIQYRYYYYEFRPEFLIFKINNTPLKSSLP